MPYYYPHELRLAAFGEDEHLKAALLELAEEFDQEAARIEARSNDGANLRMVQTMAAVGG
jgi:hypothetical protein